MRYFTYSDSDLICHHSVDLQPKDSSFTMHAHDTLEVYYFISGDCKYMVEGNEYDLKPHDVLIMRPLETHMLVVNSTNVPYERVAIQMTTQLFKEFDKDGILLKPFFDRPLGQLNHYKSENFKTDLYKNLICDFDENSQLNRRLQVVSRLFPLLGEIYRAYESIEEQSFFQVRNDVSLRLIDYINQHLFEDISLTHLSEKFFLSQSQLNRIFKSSTGSPIWEYVTIKRLLRARDLIRGGETANLASVDCGFRDYSSFYRLYKAKFQHAPKFDAPTIKPPKNIDG